MGTFLSERIVNYRCFIAGHGNRYSTLGASNNNRSTHTIDFHLSSHELLRIAIKEEPLYISALTIKKIIDLLRRAFQYAVNRDLVAQNPFENAILPKTDILKKGVREIDY